jgi:cytochrome c oxidase assembly protein subunit 15
VLKNFTNWLPQSVDRRVRVMAWTTFVVQVVIVVTGGAVRLTASGLGCPEWPTCDGSSIVTTPEMGIHGVIEFANRLLTFVLVIVAIAAFVSIWRIRRTRRDLFWLTLLVGLGIPAQAVIGGISVWTKLNPYVVGLHFVVSIALVVLSTLFVLRVRVKEPKPALLVVPIIAVTAWLVGLAQLVTIFLGILTTGSGPHAGDAQAPRNGLSSYVLQHLHSYPAYAALGLTVLLILLAHLGHLNAVRNSAVLLLAVNAAQVAVGLLQSRTGLPPLLVGTHMLLACLVAAGVTVVLYRIRRA